MLPTRSPAPLEVRLRAGYARATALQLALDKRHVPHRNLAERNFRYRWFDTIAAVDSDRLYPNMAAIRTEPTEIHMAAKVPNKNAASTAVPTRRLGLG